MLTIKTAELIGISLDWAVAKCEGAYLAGYEVDWRNNRVKKYSIDWAKGGPIIERESLWCLPNLAKTEKGHYVTGPTPLIAAMRCYVASKLGDEIEIPEEFTKC